MKSETPALFLLVALLAACGSGVRPQGNAIHYPNGVTVIPGPGSPYFIAGPADVVQDLVAQTDAVQLKDADTSNDALVRLNLAHGGTVGFMRFWDENLDKPEILRQDLRQHGVGGADPVPDDGAGVQGSVGAQAITDCLKYFPTEDRGLYNYSLFGVTHYFAIDESGRPALSHLTYPPITARGRQPDCQFKVGNLFGPPNSTYQGGHLVADALGGYGGRANLVPQNGQLNNTVWKRVENALLSCRNLKNGWVNLNVGVSYPDTVSIIPTEFRVNVLIKSGFLGLGAPHFVSAKFLNDPSGGPFGADVAAAFKAELIHAGCAQRLVSMVIDDTGSMGPVIGAVKASLADYIASTPDDPDITTTWNLTTFKDSVTNWGNTTDRPVILSWVNSLGASGGGDCPENVLGGVSTSISAISSVPDIGDAPKEMIVVTDASAQPGNVDAVIAAAQETDTRVSVLLTGDCGVPAPAGVSLSRVRASGVSAQFLSSQVVLKRIAEETGGRFYYIPGGGFADFKAALAEIFAEIENPQPADTTPPTVAVSVTPGTLWPPNHQMVPVTPSVTATDNQDPSPRVELVGVRASEPDDGQGDGSTADDVQIGPDGQIQLRAERSGKGNQRVYTITYKATDASGNIGFGSADVIVPKSQGKP